MSKNKNADKKIFQELIFNLIWIIGLAIIAVFSIIYVCKICKGIWDNTSEAWIALIIGGLGAVVTAELSYIAIWQNKKYKEQSEENNKRIEEENEKNRKQDLMIKANPKCNFVGVEYIDYYNLLHFVLCHDLSDNTLTNSSFDKYATYKNNLEFKLRFIVNDNVEYIKITKAKLGKLDKNNELWQDDMLFQNVLEDKEFSCNLMPKAVNEVEIPLRLLWNRDERCDEILSEEIKNTDKIYVENLKSLDSKESIWSLIIWYDAGNALNIVRKYKTCIEFKVINNGKEQVSNEDSYEKYKAQRLSFEILNGTPITRIINYN